MKAICALSNPHRSVLADFLYRTIGGYCPDLAQPRTGAPAGIRSMSARVKAVAFGESSCLQFTTNVVKNFYLRRVSNLFGETRFKSNNSFDS